MRMTSIVSFITFEQIAECLELDTDNEFVAGGQVTPEGFQRIFEIVAQEKLSEEQQIQRENLLVKQILEQYIEPTQLVKQVGWEKVFNKVNEYTSLGSRLEFNQQEPGIALQSYETPEGFSITFYEPVMIFINDAQYSDDSTLPEFGFDQISAEDLFIAIDQAKQSRLLDVPELEPLTEYIT